MAWMRRERRVEVTEKVDDKEILVVGSESEIENYLKEGETYETSEL